MRTPAERGSLSAHQSVLGPDEQSKPRKVSLDLGKKGSSGVELNATERAEAPLLSSSAPEVDEGELLRSAQNNALYLGFVRLRFRPTPRGLLPPYYQRWQPGRENPTYYEFERCPLSTEPLMVRRDEPRRRRAPSGMRSAGEGEDIGEEEEEEEEERDMADFGVPLALQAQHTLTLVTP